MTPHFLWPDWFCNGSTGLTHGRRGLAWPLCPRQVEFSSYGFQAGTGRQSVTTNNPHVVALEYRIEHGPRIDWSRADSPDVQDDRTDG